jgi:hypothetical protein
MDPDTRQIRIPGGPIRIEVAAWCGALNRQEMELTLPGSARLNSSDAE